MPVKDRVTKSGYIETVAGIGATLAGQATDTSAERELAELAQTKIAVEITVTFDAAADGGLRVRILEYMTSGSAATTATPGNEGTIPLSAGATVRQTFNFTVRSRYYQIELFNLDSNPARNATAIAVQVIETPESEEGWDGQTNVHVQYHDGNAWQPQTQIGTEATLSAIQTAVEIMDDWDETDRAKVNIIVGQAGITAGAGAVAANTPRMTLASDDPAVVALQIIDDWDETDRAKVNLIVGQAGITAGAGAVAANTPRMTLASDDPAVVALQTLDNAIKVDDAAFTPATDSVSMIGAEFDDVAPDGVDEGDAGALRMSANRNLYAQIRDAAGNERGANVTAANELNVIATAQPGVDIGDVTVNNAGGAAAVNIQDGGNSLTVDDGGGSLTIDGTVGTELNTDDLDTGAGIDTQAIIGVGLAESGGHTLLGTANPMPIITGQAGIAAGAGAVAANTPRVTLASDDPAVVALQIIDDWDETNRAAVNLIAGQVAITGGAGAVAANTPRMTLANDDPAVVALEKIDATSSLADAVETTVNTFTKTVAAAATPEALAGAGTLFRRATLIAKKAARTANTGIVYLGVTSGNDTQPIELNPGDIFTIEAPPGEKYDFDSWYLDVATAGDGIIAIYS